MKNETEPKGNQSTSLKRELTVGITSSVVGAIAGVVISFFLTIFTPLGNYLIDTFMPKAELSYVTMFTTNPGGVETIRRQLILANTGKKPSGKVTISLPDGAYIPIDHFSIKTKVEYKIFDRKLRYVFAPDEIDFDVTKTLVRKVEIDCLLPGQVVIISYVRDFNIWNVIDKWHIFDTQRYASNVTDNIEMATYLTSLANERYPGTFTREWDLGEFEF